MELFEQSNAINELGISIVIVTYEDQETQTWFKKKYKASYTMISDDNSSIIQQFGLLNPTYDPDTKYYGVPYPGIFLVDENGIIRAKFAEQSYRDRPKLEHLIETSKELNTPIP